MIQLVRPFACIIGCMSLIISLEKDLYSIINQFKAVCDQDKQSEALCFSTCREADYIQEIYNKCKWLYSSTTPRFLPKYVHYNLVQDVPTFASAYLEIQPRFSLRVIKIFHMFTLSHISHVCRYLLTVENSSQ